MKSLRDEIRLRRDRRGGFNFIWGKAEDFIRACEDFTVRSTISLNIRVAILFYEHKNPLSLERHSKGQFYKNTAYLERGMPYFAFVSTNAVLVSKIDKS